MKLRLSRSFDDIPAQATDDELLAWSATLGVDQTPPSRMSPATPAVARPPVEIRDITHLSDEELFADIFERAAAASGAATG